MTSTIYRNPKILRGAHDCPFCLGCGKPNDGTVVAAHSNQARDAKGAGIKAHDFRVAYLCFTCHQFVDTSNKATIEEREELWETAHRLTVAYLILSGILK